MTRALLKSGEFEMRIAEVPRGGLKVIFTVAVLVVSAPSLMRTPTGSRVEKLVGDVATLPFSLCASTTMKYSRLNLRLFIDVHVVCVDCVVPENMKYSVGSSMEELSDTSILMKVE